MTHRHIYRCPALVYLRTWTEAHPTPRNNSDDPDVTLCAVGSLFGDGLAKGSFWSSSKCT